MNAEIITTQGWDTLRETITYLDGKKHKPRLCTDPEGNMLKFFYPRKLLFTSYWFSPYGIKFAKNAKRLIELGIRAPKIDALWYYPKKRCHIVRYPKLPGKDYRELLRENFDANLLKEFLGYVDELHEKGVFFHAIHLGNVVRQDNHNFALIDITDIRFYNGPIPKRVRARNLKHILERPNDKAWWDKYLKSNPEFSEASLSAFAEVSA